MISVNPAASLPPLLTRGTAPFRRPYRAGVSIDNHSTFVNPDVSPAWWEQLPSDFHRRANSLELNPRQWLKVLGAAAIERVMRTQLSATVAGSMLPSMLEPGRARREFEALRFYEPLARAGDVSRVFLPPRKGIAIEARPASPSWGARHDIQRLELRFDSPFRPLNPAAAPTFARMKRNAVSHAQYWCHGDKPRPTLIVVHGFAMGAPWLNARMLGLEGFYRHGYDILLFTFPHHEARAEPDSWFSGQGVFANGLLHFNEVTLHAIHDLRVFIDYLRAKGVEHIGITGISLGGYTSALLACIDERLSFCIPIVPGVSPIDTFLEWQPSGMLLAHLMRRQGVDIVKMRGLIAVHNPLTYPPRIDGKRILIIGGAGDRIAAPRYVRLLQQHLSGSSLHWFPGNHVMHLGRAEYLPRMQALMDRCTGR
jgi:hypothetical protein